MQKIVLYGAGQNCKHALERIKKYYSDTIQVKGLIDKNKEGNIFGEKLLRKQEYSIEDIIVITIGARKTVAQVFEELERSGFSRVFLYLRKDNRPYSKGKGFLTEECKRIENRKSDLIPHIEIHAIDGCNLNCRGCVHFSPLYKRDSVDDQERLDDIEKVSKISQNVLSFYILGGEPFLNKNLNLYIKKARNAFPDTDIQIVTNGLLLLSCSDKCLETINDNNIIVAISVYEPTNRIIDRIVKRLEEHEISYIIRPYESKTEFVKPLASKADSCFHKRCMSDGCVNIYNGYIARCPTLMYIGKVNEKFNTKFPQNGIYRISDFDDADQLNRMMDKPVSLCDYCVDVRIPWAKCENEPQASDFISEG